MKRLPPLLSKIIIKRDLEYTSIVYQIYGFYGCKFNYLNFQLKMQKNSPLIANDYLLREEKQLTWFAGEEADDGVLAGRCYSPPVLSLWSSGVAAEDEVQRSHPLFLSSVRSSPVPV
ncbi:hypothetical protein NC652_038708 [Populus alba x Populus x berolinensis]|nr:hypothetical protein NC652_038708 [Populus alba x Populus x berolinensis]